MPRLAGDFSAMAAATSELLLAKALRGCGGQGLRGWSRELGSRAWGEGSWGCHTHDPDGPWARLAPVAPGVTALLRVCP